MLCYVSYEYSAVEWTLQLQGTSYDDVDDSGTRQLIVRLRHAWPPTPRDVQHRQFPAWRWRREGGGIDAHANDLAT